MNHDESGSNSDGKTTAPARLTLTGVEALARLLVVRHALDAEAGLNTATMVSGYPGSPLGGFDLVLDQASKLLQQHQVIHRPGVNEELALATVWGSQMGAALPYEGVDGVVGAWYGKTPGLDRSGDVLRHANAMGSGPNGGLVLFCGDDPGAKSSTLNCDSQYTFQDAAVPVLYPADPQEVIQLGLHAFAMSRQAGPLVGLKIVTAVADGAGTVELDPAYYGQGEGQALEVAGKRWRHQALSTIGPHKVPEQEPLVSEHRLAASRDYARRHGLDRTFGASQGARLGIVTSGKTYLDVMQALSDMGIAVADLERAGLRVLKLALTFPLVEETVLEFAQSVEELLVVEEKRPFIESQLRSILHEARCQVPAVGKRDRSGQPLVAATGELDAGQIAKVLTRVLPELQAPAPRGKRLKLHNIQPPARPPEYCSGCPHNRSTVVPDGALVGGGVGCHGIMYFEPRQRGLDTLPPPPMGAEGVPWIGLAPFVTERHLFQNLGDGTFSHSGLLAIRASVAAGVNVTFKILYNAVVAMTGGQHVTGLLAIPALTRELEAEGVTRIVVCTEDTTHYGSDARWAPSVEIIGRDDLAEAHRRLEQTAGVSVLVYDQRCASDARRLRRRGMLPQPTARVFINEAVCEGCGDCRAKSNCASVKTHPTEFGEKRRIDQLTCNFDYSCLEGDCPSFVTIEPTHEPTHEAASGGASRPADGARARLPVGELPEPEVAPMADHFGIYFTGIGGTGVVTAGRLLSAAAEAAGLIASSMDQTGLAQRGGAVVSHIQFVRDRAALRASSIGNGQADLYLSADIFQAASSRHLEKVRPGRTVAAVCNEMTPTAAMQQRGESTPDLTLMQKVIDEQVGPERVVYVASQAIAERVFSQPVLANVVLIGAAFQLGGLPLSLAAMEQGLSQRGGAEANLQAFSWGRWVVHDPQAVQAALQGQTTDVAHASPFEPSPRAGELAKQELGGLALPEELQPLVLRRLAQVIDYQNTKLGRRFLNTVLEIVKLDGAERGWQLSRAVLESWYRLLTYKDEWEVGRLHAKTDYTRVARELGIKGRFKVRYHLHPPTLRRLGLRHKLPLGWFYAVGFAMLRRLRWLRGTLLDPFRWDPDRRLERKLIDEYQVLLKQVVQREVLPYETRVELAASALDIKGYGQVKERTVARWRQRVLDLSPVVTSSRDAAE